MKSNIATHLVKLNLIKYHMGLFCKIVLFLNEVNLDLKKPTMYHSFILNDFRKFLGFFKIESLHCPMNLMLT